VLDESRGPRPGRPHVQRPVHVEKDDRPHNRSMGTSIGRSWKPSSSLSGTI
jgi:hypothetical protein